MKGLILSLLVSLSTIVFSQTQEDPRSSIILSRFNTYAEYSHYNNTEVISINIESRLQNGDRASLYFRGGGTQAKGKGYDGTKYKGFGALGAIVLLSGKKAHHFEFNAGAIMAYDNILKVPFALILLEGGYRYQKPKGGLLLKAKLGTSGIGAGLGYAF